MRDFLLQQPGRPEFLTRARLQPFVGCAIERFQELFPNERAAERVEGKLEPGTVGNAFEDAVRDCLVRLQGDRVTGEGGEVVEGTGYRVTVPKGWQNVGHAGGSPADVILAGDAIDGFLGGFRVNVNVTRETRLPGGLTLDDYAAAARGQLEEGPPGPQRPTSLGREDALTWSRTVEVRGERLQQQQVVALRDRTAYIVTFTARSDSFDDQLSDFEAILDSWRWK